MNKLQNNNKIIFENIKHIDEYGNEYWYARELQIVLQYSRWEKFSNVLEKAKKACENSGYIIDEHFHQMGKTIKMPKNAEKSIIEYKLSRYACYIIVQNSDPSKEVVALGQTYFAIQTRRQELREKEYNLLSEDEKRFYIRNQTRQGNYSLQQVAKNVGVKNFDKFHNEGYKGLYNGETANDIAERKELRYREDILDNMGSEELANNLFRIVQTESKLKNENIQGEGNANKAHLKVGKIVRNAIKKSGGTMPEELPTPKKSLKELEKENKRKLTKSKKQN